MRDEAEKRIGHLYPKVEITTDMTKERPDLKKYVGKKLTVIAWLWARTVKSPNPAFANVDVPLVSTFILSTKQGKEVYVEPIIEGGGYHFAIKVGKPKDAAVTKRGTSAGKRGGFRCLMSSVPITYDHIRAEGQSGRMGARLMAIVVEGERGRIYLAPTPEHEAIVQQAHPKWKPEVQLHGKCRVNVSNYGFDVFGDLFTQRQLVALSVFSELVQEARECIKRDIEAAGLIDASKSSEQVGKHLADGGNGDTAYSEAVSVYLACVIDRMAYYGSSLTTWLPKDNALRDCMPRQALAMTWDFAEGNPFGKSSGDVSSCSKAITNYLDVVIPLVGGWAIQHDAQTGLDGVHGRVISTDPPYYDNIGYADLSDFFYVWLRRSLRPVFPDIFATIAVPKAEELVATPYRHGSKEKAETFFLEGMTRAMKHLSDQSNPAFPVTIYYAFKQSEDDGDDGTASTGWETFLAAVITAGFTLTGTWPVRTEGQGRMIASGTNALASSIVLVCRPRASDAPTATRREFVAILKAELPIALAQLQNSNIAPVDLAQAAIGPGMSVYTRYAKVLDAEGKQLTVRAALGLINQTLDEVLTEHEGDFDEDTRWALAWFEQFGFAEGEYGVAETLSKAKNTSVSGMVEAGILESGQGKVRLLRPNDLPEDWDPTTDKRLPVWEMVHHLIRVLESDAEPAAAALVAKLGADAETARELCYRLYTICDRKKRTTEALSYNGLVQSWPEITRLAQNITPQPVQGELL